MREESLLISNDTNQVQVSKRARYNPYPADQFLVGGSENAQQQARATEGEGEPTAWPT